MKKWVSMFIAALLAMAGVLPVSAEEESREAVQRLQETEYKEGQAIVKVSRPVQRARSGFFAEISCETEVLMDVSRFDVPETWDGSDVTDGSDLTDGSDPVTASDADGRRHPHPLLQGAGEAQTALEDNAAELEEKLLLVTSDTLSTEELIAALEQRPEVEYAEPDYALRFASLPDDPYVKKQWHLHDDAGTAAAEKGSARISHAWKSGTVENAAGSASDSSTPVVAVIDSGIDYTHEDLTGMMWNDGSGSCGMDFTDPDDSDQDGPMDRYGHGTHVAGIIGAQTGNQTGVSGISRNLKLMALKISDDQGAFYASAALQAYQYMLEKKNEGVNIIAANNSWGGYYYSRALEEAFDLAGDNGIVSTAASGNESIDHDLNLNSPEAGDRTMFLLVNASDEKGRPAAFSDYGLVDTDLYAQGMNLYSTVIDSEAGYRLDDPNTVLWADGLTQEPAIVTENPAAGQAAASGNSRLRYIAGTDISAPCLQWTIEAETEGETSCMQWNAGDLSGASASGGSSGGASSIPDAANYLAFSIGQTDAADSMTNRNVQIYLKGTAASGGTEWIQVTGGGTVPYGLPGSYVLDLNDLQDSQGNPATAKDDIDWADFTVRICRKATGKDIDTAKTLTFRLEKMALLSDASSRLPYGYMDGTSAAAPVAAGSVALLYDYYDVEKIADPEKQKDALAEIRARIAGGVTRTDELETRCASGGYLNLKKAIDHPYPVLDALEQNGSKAAIRGYFFGSKGTLTMDGTPVTVLSWGDREITFTLPAGTAEGLHEFKVTNETDPADGTAQYGRDKLWTEAVTDISAGTSTGAFFERLDTPDFEELNLLHAFAEQSYSMAAYDGRIYVTQPELREEGQEGLAILVYDEETEAWSAITAEEVRYDNDIQLFAGERGLYLVENSPTGDGKSQLQVFKMTEEGSFRQTGDAFIHPLSAYQSMAFDGRYLWVMGGAQVYADGTLIPDDRILRFDARTGQWEETDMVLKTARYSAAAEAIGGKLIVTGGTNRYGRWESSTEIIDAATGEVAQGADFPQVYQEQQSAAASGQYDGKLIVTGMFDTKAHSADTYVYDPKRDKWETLDQRLMDTKVFLMDGAVSGEYFYVYGITLDGGNKKDVFRRLKIGENPAPEDAGKDKDGTDEDGGAEGTASGTTGSGRGGSGHLNTGDGNRLMLWFMLMTAAGTAAVGMILRRE